LTKHLDVIGREGSTPSDCNRGRQPVLTWPGAGQRLDQTTHPLFIAYRAQSLQVECVLVAIVRENKGRDDGSSALPERREKRYKVKRNILPNRIVCWRLQIELDCRERSGVAGMEPL
jgi:hypothetical protein